jgi:hypothetical protein
LRVFKWSVRAYGLEPVCVVDMGAEAEPDAVKARREWLCRATRELNLRLILVPREEWRAAMMGAETDAVVAARQWFPHLPVTPEVADGLLLLAWALVKIEKGGF